MPRTDKFAQAVDEAMAGSGPTTIVDRFINLMIVVCGVVLVSCIVGLVVMYG